MDFANLRALVAALDSSGRAEGWDTHRVGGGANGLLYFGRREDLEVAVKFYAVDAYDRAAREYDALRVLEEADPALAPRPLLYEPVGFSHPVVVQSWLTGVVSAAPPQNDADWTRLLEHYVALARIRPDATPIQLRRTVLNASSFGEAKALVRIQTERLPETGYRGGLTDLLERLFAYAAPEWPRPEDALCRGDSNLLNFVRRTGAWCSLDWEYSGWGDPVFEIAELIAHPAYADVSEERADWLVRHYSERTGKHNALERTDLYLVALYVWWTVRFARYLYEVPRGLDRRLVTFPKDFLSRAEHQYERYRQKAARRLETL